MTDAATDRPPEFLRRDAEEGDGQIARAELLLETHRVTGAVEGWGPQRRLVDALNAADGLVVVVRDVTLEGRAAAGEEPRHLDLLHVRREAILLAVPLSVRPPSRSEAEAVEKRRTAATLVLPGLEVTGHIYLPSEADPSAVRLIGRRDFLPVTEAEVAELAFTLGRWRQPLVVVNLERVLLYAPAPR